jgi:hypothetical protein
MRRLHPAQGLIAAVEIDTLSLLVYEVGMFIWMAVQSRVYPELRSTSLTYWLMMQITMLLGFATTAGK